MLRIPVPVIFLATLFAAAQPALGQPFFLVYASSPAANPVCTLPIDPASAQGGNPAALPVLPPVDVPVGGTLTLDLCFLVWPAVNSTTGQVVCSNGLGTESCAEQLVFNTNGGIQIVGFTPIAPGTTGFPKYQAHTTASSIQLMGGNPVVGRQGSGLVGLRLGSVVLSGVHPAGTFSLADGGWVNASMQTVSPLDTVIATTENHCGNSVLDPGEECEDGNTAFADGCAPTCRIETGFTLEGSVGPPGSSGTLALQIDGVDVTLDLATMPNAPAEEVMLALVSSVNDTPTIGSTAVQADDAAQPGSNDGRRFVTDGAITGGPTLQITNGTIAVPESGSILGIAAGSALLAALARRRARRRH